jgi:hypothetical protein
MPLIDVDGSRVMRFEEFHLVMLFFVAYHCAEMAEYMSLNHARIFELLLSLDHHTQHADDDDDYMLHMITPMNGFGSGLNGINSGMLSAAATGGNNMNGVTPSATPLIGSGGTAIGSPMGSGMLSSGMIGSSTGPLASPTSGVSDMAQLSAAIASAAAMGHGGTGGGGSGDGHRASIIDHHLQTLYNSISVERFKLLGRLMGLSDAHMVRSLEAHNITFFTTIHASVCHFVDPLPLFHSFISFRICGSLRRMT